MRKLKLQVQISIDGFIAGPNGEMDWMAFPWTEDINKHVTQITDTVDTIVLGRKLAEGFIPHWASVAADPNNPEVMAGKKFTDTQKVVFTKTLGKSNAKDLGWSNTVIAQGNLVDEINKLKKQDGNDIIAYGGANFVSALTKAELIDEFHLFVNPAVLGKGMSIFKELEVHKKLELKTATVFKCGIVDLTYVRN